VVIEVLAKMMGIEIDFADLDKQGEVMEQKLIELLDKMKLAIEDQSAEQDFTERAITDQDNKEEAESDPEPVLGLEARQRIERLFEKSRRDRTAAIELKQELDRLGVFDRYEDRFLDLFKKAE